MILRAENIKKKYGSRYVVKGISLEVEQGQIVGLLGPNGAGKTTSFYMIVGMVSPNEGQIYLDDRPITSFPCIKEQLKVLVTWRKKPPFSENYPLKTI